MIKSETTIVKREEPVPIPVYPRLEGWYRVAPGSDDFSWDNWELIVAKTTPHTGVLLASRIGIRNREIYTVFTAWLESKDRGSDGGQFVELPKTMTVLLSNEHNS